MTLFDRAVKADENRKEREKNIKFLSERLDEAKLLYSLLQGNHYETQLERQVVGDEISRLQGFIDDEERSIRIAPSQQDLKKVFG